MASLLFVDDEEEVRVILCELFEGKHKCDTAATAEEALTKLAAEGDNYDLIVTDVHMPGMSGEDLLGFVRIYRPTTPVIFLTGASDPNYAAQLIRKGAADYLSKPFRLPEIEEKVARALRQRRRL
jgi:DNA-binding NtrC family response regulator